jgi:hypothetical protein
MLSKQLHNYHLRNIKYRQQVKTPSLPKRPLPKRTHFLPKRPPLYTKTPPLFTKNDPTLYQNAPFFSKINHYKTNFICDSNVYKCVPAIRFCSNILFLFYYICINLFIKIINLINDDCIKLNLFIAY